MPIASLLPMAPNFQTCILDRITTSLMLRQRYALTALCPDSVMPRQLYAPIALCADSVMLRQRYAQRYAFPVSCLAVVMPCRRYAILFA